MPTRKRFKANLSLALCHYHMARTIVLGAFFSVWVTFGGLAATPGVATAWVLALLVGALTAMLPWAKVTEGLAKGDGSYFMVLFYPTIAFFFPLLFASAILPLSTLFMIVVQLAYSLARLILAHIGSSADGNAQVWVGLPKMFTNWGCCSWINNLAGPARTCLSWLKSTSIFSHLDGVLGRPQGEALAFTSTSYAMLAGGLSCFWVLLALAPLISHIAWARALTSYEGAAAVSNETAAVAVQDLGRLSGEWNWVWGSIMMWLWLGAAIVKVPSSCRLGLKKTKRDIISQYGSEEWDKTIRTPTLFLKTDFLRYWARALFPSFYFVLLLFIFTASQTADAKQRIAITYANSFEAIGTLGLDGIFPSLDELVNVLGDPATALSNVVQRIANLSSYAEFDPAYFAEGVQALKSINLVLGFVKLLATYGRKLFALMDAAKQLLKTYTGYEAASEGDDGTVQVYETMTDLEAIAILVLLNKVAFENAKSFAKVEVALLEEALNFDGCRLDDGDIAGLIALVTHPEMTLQNLTLQKNDLITAQAWEQMLPIVVSKGLLKELQLAGNMIGPMGGIAIAGALKLNGSLTSLNISSSMIGDRGAAAIAEALKVSGSLISIDISYNDIGKEMALKLVETFKEKQMTCVCLGGCSLGADGAKEVAKYVRVSGSLASLDVGFNDIGKEAALELVSIFVEKQMTSIGLANCGLDAEAANIVAQYVRASGSLTSLDISFNQICGSCGEYTGIRAVLQLSDGINAICDAFSVNSLLTSLNLSGNSIGLEGGMLVAEALRAIGSLTSLNLRGNYLGNEGSKAVAEALLVRLADEG